MTLEAPVPGVDYQPGCTRPDCVCQKPGKPCDEYQGIAEERPWCPRCGWHKRHHPDGAS